MECLYMVRVVNLCYHLDMDGQTDGDASNATSCAAPFEDDTPATP